MKRVVNAIENLSRISGEIASYMVIPLTLVILYTVIMRRFFGNSPDWGFEVTIFLFGIMILLTGADTLRTKGHITVDILLTFIKGKPKLILLTFIHILVIITSFLLLIKGVELAVESTRIVEYSAHQTSFNPPIWWFKWFIPISALILWLQSLVELYKLWFEKGGSDYGTNL
ncbi:TRAP transporter small permease subunit [Oceanobacillus oncorhynchi]|uniref:TRAP transporter small permease subunit n=1 Tax=Oceanobacillus oncorhynchi TaxID=545501 RepID=UPI00186957EE|nr:TRAP transporter small permease [Oceanobacillus oncorhynchi]